MKAKIAALLAKQFLISPEIKAVLIEVGAELDRLRAEVDELRSKNPNERK